MNNNLEQLYRQVIMEHYKNPKNKGLINDEGYYTVHLNNPSCGDDVNVQVKIVDDVIVDIKHSGIGCSMCCSSASIMSETLKGKTTKEALEIIDNFYELVKGEKVNDKINWYIKTLKYFEDNVDNIQNKWASFLEKDIPNKEMILYNKKLLTK